MPITYTHTQTKERIISAIQLKGPSLPVHIARTISVSPLFAAAFLSELYEEGKLRMSHMRVGSSPLYLLPGQEEKLANFSEYLNQKEKEALSLLQKEKVLEDESQHPAIRVALRSIKDFALPLRIKTNDNVKLYWKYFTVQDSEVKSILEPSYVESPPIETPKLQSPAPKLKQIQETLAQNLENNQLKKPETELKKEIYQGRKEMEEKKSARRTKPKTESNFEKKIKEYLSAKEIEILEIIISSKKEFSAKVRIDTLFGKQEYYLVAKDKKKLIESDLSLAVQKAHVERMPAVIMSQGDIDKKALESMKHWKGMLKFEKIKF